MKKLQSIMILILLALGGALAQSDSSQQAGGAPPAAFGQDNAPAQENENPPLSGIDQPSLEPKAAARSFLLPGLHVSEALDSNVGSAPGGASMRGVTRVLGSLALEQLRSHSDTALSYIGGGAFYSGGFQGDTQMHQFSLDERIRWRRGQLGLRDAFSYLPEGSFGGGSMAGVGGIPQGLGGGLSGGGFNFFGPGQFGALSQQPRITNTALVDITENLSPRSAMTLAGSYGLVRFINSGLGFINSRQVSAQAGYNHVLSRRHQFAVIYGFQSFRFPGGFGNSFSSHVGHLIWGYRISGRMDLQLGGGPQVTIISNPLLGSTQRLSMSGRASLRYRFPRTSVSLLYNHYNTNGSGFFAGANSDIARLSASRPLGRLWNGMVDVGYSRNSRIQKSLFGGVSALSYNYGYAGGTLHRQLGRNFSMSLGYQFNQQWFDSSFCGSGGGLCSRYAQRHVVTIGLDWHPRPIRLD